MRSSDAPPFVARGVDVKRERRGGKKARRVARSNGPYSSFIRPSTARTSLDFLLYFALCLSVYDALSMTNDRAPLHRFHISPPLIVAPAVDL